MQLLDEHKVVFIAIKTSPNCYMTFENALRALKIKDVKGLQFVLLVSDIAEKLDCPKIVGFDFYNATQESKEEKNRAKLDPEIATYDLDKLAEIRALNTSYAEPFQWARFPCFLLWICP